ncbi:MAG: hypothetical protein KF760_18385 [Candidatus Eremiobacteraeota bacterium]|nr:hypothetical protein [Candidatus Eremiobacteraeota bacterium]MCW5869369.1 hypothetical protein [Candidatus Eremiobacteraeota bacterium]
MTIHTSLPSELRRLQTQRRLERALLSADAPLSRKLALARLAYCNTTLENIQAVQHGGGKSRGDLLDLLPGSADYGLVEAATDLCAGDSLQQVETRNNYRDAFTQALRSAARARRSGQTEMVRNGDKTSVTLLDEGALVDIRRADGGHESLVQQGTRVWRSLDGVRGESFRLEDGQPVCEPSLLTLAGPMPAEFMSRGAVNYAALSFLGLDELHLETIPEPSRLGAPADIVNDLNGGELWGPRSVLKPDAFKGRGFYTDGKVNKASDDPEDAPNYRKMPDYPVHGVGQPTAAGFRKLFRHLGKKPVIWLNTRAEAVIYISEKPYNVRELSRQLNIPYKQGATGAELDELEKKLKAKLIELSAKEGGIPMQEELSVQDDKGNWHPRRGPNGEIMYKQPVEKIQVTAENCRTTEETIQEAARDEGVTVEYRRVPIQDESAPTPAELDQLRRSVHDFQQRHPGEDAHYIANCQMGRGRTTTAMVAIAMTLDAEKGTRTDMRELQEKANQITDLLLNIVKTDQKVREGEAKLAELEAARPRNQVAIDIKRAEVEEFKRQAQEFRERQLELEMYSLYLTEQGSNADTSFEGWMGEEPQQAELKSRRAKLELQLKGLELALYQMQPAERQQMAAFLQEMVMAA